MQSHGIIGLHAFWREDGGITLEGAIVACWPVGGCLWLAMKVDGIPYPVAMKAEDVEIVGWE